MDLLVHELPYSEGPPDCSLVSEPTFPQNNALFVHTIIELIHEPLCVGYIFLGKPSAMFEAHFSVLDEVVCAVLVSCGVNDFLRDTVFSFVFLVIIYVI